MHTVLLDSLLSLINLLLVLNYYCILNIMFDLLPSPAAHPSLEDSCFDG